MKLRYVLIAALFCPLLAGCDTDIKETLGLNRKAPDEFQVYQRPPLSVPPEFNLKPPSAEDNTNAVAAQEKARTQVLSDTGAASAATAGAAILSGAAGPQTTGGSLNLATGLPVGAAATTVPVVSAAELPTNGDSQFLADIGAAKSDPQIRQKILNDQLNGVGVKDNTYLLGNKKVPDPEVDPAKEAERLKQDKAQDKPPTAGDTPVIAPKENGILGDIF